MALPENRYLQPTMPIDSFQNWEKTLARARKSCAGRQLAGLPKLRVRTAALNGLSSSHPVTADPLQTQFASDSAFHVPNRRNDAPTFLAAVPSQSQSVRVSALPENACLTLPCTPDGPSSAQDLLYKTGYRVRDNPVPGYYWWHASSSQTGLPVNVAMTVVLKSTFARGLIDSKQACLHLLKPPWLCQKSVWP